MTLSDEQLREALAPLRAERPSEAEVLAVVAAASSVRPRKSLLRRRLWRGAVAVAAATACAAVALSVLPGSPQGPASRPGSAPSILRATAAVAAEQPEPAPGRYRYVDWLDRWTQLNGAVTYEQRVETWVDENYEGHRIQHEGRVSSDDPVVDGRILYERSEGPYLPDGPRTRLAELPTAPEALRDALVDEYKSANRRPGRPGENQAHYDLVRKVVHLLGLASEPKLRAALFELMALTPGVEPAPGAIDPRGRGGRAVRIPTRPDGSGGRITVIFDPHNGELLSWSEAGTGGGTPDQSHTILGAGQVAAIGDRPGHDD
jgi:hypothetical protein